MVTGAATFEEFLCVRYFAYIASLNPFYHYQEVSVVSSPFYRCKNRLSVIKQVAYIIELARARFPISTRISDSKVGILVLTGILA